MTVWGLGNTIIAAVDMSGIVLSFYRLLLGALLYVAVLYARGGRLGRRSFRLGGWGGVAFGLNVATFFAALQLTSVANATTISALQPLAIMAFAAVMFGERIRARHVVCAVVATVGVALVAFGTSRGATGSITGDVMAVLALIVLGLVLHRLEEGPHAARHARVHDGHQHRRVRGRRSHRARHRRAVLRLGPTRRVDRVC